MTTLVGRHRRHRTFTLTPGEELTLAVKQVTNPHRVSMIRQERGLTDAHIIIEGRLVEPRSLPATVRAGATGKMPWGGRLGNLRLEPYEDAVKPRWRRKFGERLIFSWKSDEIP